MSLSNWNNKRIFVTVLLFIALSILVVCSIFHPGNYFSEVEYNVRVTNGFTNNSSLPLVIWCISSEDMDIGGRALQERDDYSWSFKASPFTFLWTWWQHNSNYRCTMKWDQRRKKFDAFKFPRDFRRCGPLRRCSWLVKEDGFYFSNDDLDWNKDFSWS
ncbi:hypothetical protein ACFE04_008692 [Oxalis oulophora]